ncbi:SLBB domain-containing protein [Paraglaciecola hydrolytica]|uniref:Polysaccharide biosynthesis protein n=1 Tax=Paraglaciecola hydrolytica TaxID=1799789 RepID=A0A135ZYV0_9ALTE|nr:SLBB domain-containing protein [Paraglaciecola hydrolytica]KXI28144.1 hypothetical protein AX660_17315 [Paraglaciecola hydrolytica]
MLRHFQLSSLLLTLLFCFFSSLVWAQSAQQIEQFKKLPKAQQEQLARQYGIDLSSLEGLSSSTSFIKNDTKNNENYSSNKTFDEFGNPIVDDNKNDKTRLNNDAEQELKLYGSDLFTRSVSSFTPTSGVPVPANYLIAPGDELVIQLFGKENEKYNLEVAQDGNIVVPRLGPIAVATKSFAEAKSFLSEQIKKQIIGVEVSVTMGELSTIRVFVMGESLNPGAYNVSSLSTITHTLVVSGGVSDIASLRNIQLKRAGQLITTLDIYDLLNNGDSTNDVLLRSGDVIFIPTIKRSVSVDGQVRRPAIYELKNEDKLSDVINLAGGKLPQGYESTISIQRFVNGARVQITAKLDSLDTKIMDGDSISVPEVSAFLSDSVTLIGAVARPGDYQWKAGIRINDIIVDVQKDLLEFADLSYVLILREINRSRDIEILQTNFLDESDSDKVSNVALQPNDKIVVFSKNENEALIDTTLTDMAFSQTQLVKKEKEQWRKRIDEKLFWKSIGVSDEKIDPILSENETYALQNQPIVQLSDLEKKQIIEFKDHGFFSRKRLLVPILEKLNQQARMGSPLQILEIAGEVKVPGIYPLTKNASIKDVIVAAGGFTESTYMKKSEITRSEINSNGVAQISHISFSPSDIWQASSEELALKSKDRINVFTTPSWQQELKVTVKGEVEFPGEYSIRRGETLGDLIERVGFLTKYGDADAAVFTRETLKKQEKENLQKLAGELRKQIAAVSLRKQSGAGRIVSYDEAKKLLKDLTDVEAVGRLVIDFEGILAGSKKDDVILQDGDILYVPGKSQSVNVIGEVYVPTSHMFTAGIMLGDYVSKSGGYRSSADRERTYVIRANGSVFVPDDGGSFWFSSHKNEQLGIKPGDTIVVPLDSDNVDNMTLWANATQIIYQLAVAVAAIGSL